MRPDGTGRRPQPMTTYYPSAIAVDQAQPITLQRGQSVSDVDVMLGEGLPAVITGVVTGLDGQPVAGQRACERAVRFSAREWGSDGTGTGIRQDGTFRFTVGQGNG